MQLQVLAEWREKIYREMRERQDRRKARAEVSRLFRSEKRLLSAATSSRCRENRKQSSWDYQASKAYALELQSFKRFYSIMRARRKRYPRD